MRDLALFIIALLFIGTIFGFFIKTCIIEFGHPTLEWRSPNE